MATNDFIGFASAGNANVMSQADYAAAAEQGVGVQPGMASSALANKLWRQGANMAAVIGELIKNHGIDALDNGDLTTLYNALLSATASITLAGLMSAEDKIKLDSIDLTLYALLNSPAFTGTPTAPTPEDSDDSTRIATTEYVNNRLPFSSGTWTPVLIGSSSDGAFTYSEQTGIYARLKNLVFIFARLDFNMVLQPTGACVINGLPFVSASSVINYGWQPFINIRGNGGVDNCLASIAQGIILYNSAQIVLRKTYIPNNSPGMIAIKNANFNNTTSDVYIQLNNNLGRFDIAGMYFTQ